MAEVTWSTTEPVRRWQPPARQAVAVSAVGSLRFAAMILAALIVWITVQDVALAFGFRYVPVLLIRGGLVLKELLLAVTLLLLVLSRRPDGARIGLFGVSIGYWVVIAATYGGLGLMDGLGTQAVTASMRSALVPAALLTAGRLLHPTRAELQLLLTTVLAVSVASALFGLVERFVLGDRFWTQTVDLPGFLTVVKGVGLALRPGVGLPWNFWWGDSLGLVRRLAGLNASPLAVGYALVLPTTIAVSAALFHAPRRLPIGWMPIAVVCGIALIFTVTRLALIALALSLALVVLLRVTSGRNRLGGVFAAIGAAIVVGLLVLGTVVLSSGNAERIWAASWALSDGSSSARLGFVAISWSRTLDHLLIGAGFGSAGAWSSSSATSESGYLALLYQLGLPGAAAFMIPWTVAAAQTVRVSIQREDDGLRYARVAVLAATVGLVPTAIFSEQMLAFTSSGAYWLLLGALSLPTASSVPAPARTARPAVAPLVAAQGIGATTSGLPRSDQ